MELEQCLGYVAAGHAGIPEAEWLRKHVRDIVADKVSRIVELQAELDAGAKELRRYVEGNGFIWCEEETTVFNVVSALGWMGGEIKMCHERLDKRDEPGAKIYCARDGRRFNKICPQLESATCQDCILSKDVV